jgi:hypothetical protein
MNEVKTSEIEDLQKELQYNKEKDKISLISNIIVAALLVIQAVLLIATTVFKLYTKSSILDNYTEYIGTVELCYDYTDNNTSKYLIGVTLDDETQQTMLSSKEYSVGDTVTLYKYENNYELTIDKLYKQAISNNDMEYILLMIDVGIAILIMITVLTIEYSNKGKYYNIVIPRCTVGIVLILLTLSMIAIMII